jgi:hypothetical protein
MNPTLRFASIIALCSLLYSPVFGQYTLTQASPVISENFDGMGSSATATVPANWRVSNPNVFRSVSDFSTAGTSTTVRGGNSLGTGASHGIYNFGAGDAASATDRAIGGLSTSNTNSRSVNIYTWLRNTGTTDIANFSISYAIEKYRNGSNAAGFSIQLYYSSDGTTWTSAGSDFLSNFGADANNDGFVSAPGSTTPVSGVLNVSLPVGDTLYLAWNYSVSSGSTSTNSQALAVDDVSITANFIQISLADNSPQIPIGTVNVGSVSQELYRFTVEALNGAVQMDSLRVLTNGTYTGGDIDQFSLLTAAVNDKSLAVPVGGTVSGTSAGQSLLFTPNQTQAAASTRYYWVVADIAAGASIGNTVGVGIPVVHFAQGSSSSSLSAAGLRTIDNLTPSVNLASQNPAVPGGNLPENDTLTPLYRFELSVANAPVTFTQLDFSTSGSYAASEITGLSLYRSSAATFNPANVQRIAFLSNPGVAGAKSFTGMSTSVLSGSTTYFYIVAHTPCVASAGGTISVSAVSTSGLSFSESPTLSGTAEAGGSFSLVRPALQVNTPIVNGAAASASLSWGNPACLDQVLVVMRPHQAVSFVPSGDGSAYTASSVWTNGSDLGSSQFVVYSGTGAGVTVTQLVDGAEYHGVIFVRRGLSWSVGVTFTVQPDSPTLDGFATIANWIQGSGALGSYQSDHIYQGSGFFMTGGPALRELASTGDGTVNGFPRTFNGSPYAWRMENNSSVNWVITVPQGGIGTFSITLRRWTGGVNLALEFSDDNGQNWSGLDTITATRLNNSNDWLTISHTLNNSRDSLRLRLRALGTTERVMIGGFSFTPSISTWDGSGWSRGVPDVSQDIRIISNRSVADDISCRNVFLENGTFEVQSGQVLEVAGNVVSSGGALDVSAGVLRMSGTAAQALNIGAIQGGGISRLDVNNASGVTLSGGALEITDSLALQSGFLTLGADVLTLSGGIGGSGSLSGSATSQLRINGSGSFGPLTFTNGARSLSTLEINRSGTVSLGSFLDIHTTLDLQAGLVELGSHNLTLLSAGGLVGGGGASYIVNNGAGALRRTIGSGGAYTFPLGSSTNYNPAVVTWGGTPGVTRLDARFIVGAPSNATGLSVLVDSIEVNTLLDGGYWSIQAIGTVEDPYQISLTSVGHSNADAVRRNHAIVKRSTPASAWEAAGKWSAPAGDSLMQATDTITLVQGQIASFSDFSIGSGDPIPLPVQLIFFKAQLDGNSVVLHWQTASEINNSHFEIERSIDLQNFENIGEVAGNGTTSEVNDYTFKDLRPHSGLSYYRLRQVDFDGSYAYSTLAAVQMGGAAKVGFRMFPQPCASLCYLESGAWYNSPLRLSWHSFDGREIVRRSVDTGALHVLQDLGLPAGLYLLKVERMDTGELEWVRWVAN